MDIEFLWVLGGWFPGPEIESCMAKDEGFTKTQVFGLWLVLLLLLAHPSDQLKTTVASSFSARRLLSPSSQSMKLHPQKTPPRQFDGNKHEVPSGPNPISNR
ncbi:hypothetical protein AAC387_Pa12g1637 [Persea americana]